MDSRYVLSLVLNAHLPFVREYTGNHNNSETALLPGTIEENWLFESITETYLPLLEVFDRLEGDHIPFKLGISVSPLLGQMLCDELLMKKFNSNMANRMEFGRQEIERLKDNPGMYDLAKYYFDLAVDRQAAFTTRYEGNILKSLNYYRQKGRVEFLAAPASHAFLPFLCPYPESVQAQLEASQLYYRYTLGISPQGIWLPELGWTKDLDNILRAYSFNYTITDSHGFVLGDPPPSHGSFYPVKTPQNLFVFSRDHLICEELQKVRNNDLYRENNRDIGHELPHEQVTCFLTKKGARCDTGYKYWKSGNNNKLYDHAAAKTEAGKHAGEFVKYCSNHLACAAKHMKEQPIGLMALDADKFGRHWYEGPHFLETMFRRAADNNELRFMTPSEYLIQQPLSSLEVSMPDYSSWGSNGYAETWLDSSNDWIYRHLNRSADRMVELAERFSEDSGLKERALNQAARELLLAQASDWPAMLKRQEHTAYARTQLEGALRNFTTIYEALGSSHIDTEWLTVLERRHNIFPGINYRIFRRKR